MNSNFQSEFLTYVESSSNSEGRGGEGGHVKSVEDTQETVDLTGDEKVITISVQSEREKSPATATSSSTSPYGTRRQKSGIVKTKNYCVLLGKIQDKFPVVKGTKKTNLITKRKISHQPTKPRDRSPKGKATATSSSSTEAPVKSTQLGIKMGTPDGSSEKAALAPDSGVGHRPKRHITPKNLEDSCGLSWKEEKELKKALSASLKDTKMPTCLPAFTTEPQVKDKKSTVTKPHAHKLSTPVDQIELFEKLKKKKMGKRDNLKLVIHDGKSSESAKSGTSNASQNAKNHFALKHVRAQRKFAQGSRPDSPSTTPVKYKSITTPKKVVANKRAKTEDFLTFLCLRGSSALPPHLEYFNYSESESLQSFPNTPRHSQDGSRPSTPAQASATEAAATPTGKAETQPRGSPDREIRLDNEELGVSPLVATANSSVGVVVGNSPSVSARQNSTNELAVRTRTRATSINDTTLSFPSSSHQSELAPNPRAVPAAAGRPSPQVQPEMNVDVTVSMTAMTYSSAVAGKSSTGKSYPVMCVGRQASMVRMCEGVAGTSMQTVQHYQNMASGMILPRNSASEKVEAATQTGDSSSSERDEDPTSSDSSSAPRVLKQISATATSNNSSSDDDQTKVAIMQPSNLSSIGQQSTVVNPMCQNVVGSDQIISFTNISTNPTAFVTPPQFMTTFLPSAVTLPTVTLPTVAMDPGALQSLPAGLMLNTMSTCIQNTAVIQQPTPGLYGSDSALATHTQGGNIYGAGPSHSLGSPGSALLYPPAVENSNTIPQLTQPPDNTPTLTPIKDSQTSTDTPKKPLKIKMKEKKPGPVLGSKLAKKSKIPSASMTIAKQLGLDKKRTAGAYSSVTVIPRTNSPMMKVKDSKSKSVLKGIKVGKVTKKGSLQKQHGNKLVKKAKQTASQSRLRPATRALTAHIESQKLELAKAGADDYELLTTDDVIILSSPESSPTSTPKSPTKRQSQSDKEERTPAKKVKSSNGKEADTPSSESRKTRGKASQSPVSTRSKAPSGQEPTTTKATASPSGKKLMANADSSGSAAKPKAAKQLLTKSPGPGRPRLSTKDSPSNTKAKSPAPSKPKTIMPKISYRTSFPQSQEAAKVVDIPTYHPSPEQFEDPINYISSIRADAESYGMCCIVPPEGWKPECKMSEELRFTTQVQYIHRLQNRWGPSVLQMASIRKHLESQGITMDQPPLVGGNELDMPALSQAIRSCGGLQTVIDEEKWREVTQQLKVPKIFQERSQRLCEIYCKYLLSYDTLSEEERTHLEEQAAREQERNIVSYQDCMARGRSRTLGEFFRASRNLSEMWYDEEEPKPESVENDYWKIVREGTQHVTSQIVHIDTKNCGSAFPTKKESPYYKHGWNFNMLQHNRDSVLRYIGQVSGVTVPMLHIGMLFSTCCWSREPHFLPYISYLHTGADQIWYCIPKSEEAKFKKVLEDLVPDLVDPDSPIWLPEDAIMVSPEILTQRGVSLCRHVQQQGQFIVVFPEAFTATISCGYNITESINFATPDWIPLGCKASQILYESEEPDLFSIERLLLAIARDAKAPAELHKVILPHLESLILREVELRKKVVQLGLRRSERLAVTELPLEPYGKRRHSHDISPDEENRCDESKKMCYLSAVVNESQEVAYCIEQGIRHIIRKSNRKSCLLLYRFEENELLDILTNVRNNVTSAATRLSRRKSLKSQ